LGMETSGLALMYTSPFHASDYFHYLSSNFGLVKKAHAASNGIGFQQLQPIMQLWIAFRNLAYLLFVIIFVVVGFAIMLRAKIDPRTVMTIENQIPKLIVALLLITFSFAIAGFMIDIMWVAIYLIINLFATLDPTGIGQQVGPLTSAVNSNIFDFTNNMFSANSFGGFLQLPWKAAQAVGNIGLVLSQDFFNHMGGFKIIFGFILDLPGTIGCSIGGLLPNLSINLPLGIHIGSGASATGDCIDKILATEVGGLLLAIAFIIFAIALIVALARVLWNLLKAYTLFLVFAIFGPIIIMLGVVPGSKNNFEYWLRHIAAYTICFPTAISILLLGKTIMDLYGTTITAAPPLIGVNPQTLSFLGPLLGFAVIMLIPQSLSLVQENLSAPDPKFLAGIGQQFGAGAKLAGGTANAAWKRAFHERNLQTGQAEGFGTNLLLGGVKNGAPDGTAIQRFLRGIVYGKRYIGGS